MSDGEVNGVPVEMVLTAAAPAGAAGKSKRGRGETVARWGVAELGADGHMRIRISPDCNPELHKTEQGALRAIEAAGLDRAWLVREVKIERKARLL